MGARENPSIAELMCYFCNLSLDCANTSSRAKKSSKGKNWSCSSVPSEESRPTLVDTVDLLEEAFYFYRDASTFCGKNKTRGGVIKGGLFGWWCKHPRVQKVDQNEALFDIFLLWMLSDVTDFESVSRAVVLEKLFLRLLRLQKALNFYKNRLFVVSHSLHLCSSFVKRSVCRSHTLYRCCSLTSTRLRFPSWGFVSSADIKTRPNRERAEKAVWGATKWKRLPLFCN